MKQGMLADLSIRAYGDKGRYRSGSNCLPSLSSIGTNFRCSQEHRFAATRVEL